MSIDEMLVAMSTTATVLGFFCLAAIFCVLVWGCVVVLRMISTAFDNWRYTRRRKRKDDDEFSEIKSAWLREKIGLNRTDTVESHRVVVPSVDRTTTEEFPSTVDDIQTYWTEKDNHDAA